MSATIEQQAKELSAASASHMPPEVAAVFGAEQQSLRERALGLDLAQVNETIELPMPTVLIVGTDRVVRFADTHADYTTRTEVSDIISALDAEGWS